jgi:hypothetical protein
MAILSGMEHNYHRGTPTQWQKCEQHEQDRDAKSLAKRGLLQIIWSKTFT